MLQQTPEYPFFCKGHKSLIRNHDFMRERRCEKSSCNATSTHSSQLSAPQNDVLRDAREKRSECSTCIDSFSAFFSSLRTFNAMISLLELLMSPWLPSVSLAKTHQSCLRGIAGLRTLEREKDALVPQAPAQTETQWGKTKRGDGVARLQFRAVLELVVAEAD